MEREYCAPGVPSACRTAGGPVTRAADASLIRPDWSFVSGRQQSHHPAGGDEMGFDEGMEKDALRHSVKIKVFVGEQRQKDDVVIPRP